jgi:hypothetical protein
MTWSMTHWMAMLEATVHRAKTDAPVTAMANGRGCRRTSAEIMPKPRRARSNRRFVVGEPT